MDKLITAISEVEGLADHLEQVSAELVEIDRRRQGLREGARALKKQVQAAACDVPVWIELPGGASVQLAYSTAEEWLSEESRRVEQTAEGLAQKQKRIVRQITEKNGTPDGCSEAMVNAFLQLKS